MLLLSQTIAVTMDHVSLKAVSAIRPVIPLGTVVMTSS